VLDEELDGKKGEGSWEEGRKKLGSVSLCGSQFVGGMTLSRRMERGHHRPGVGGNLSSLSSSFLLIHEYICNHLPFTRFKLSSA
jgi:hypothetical protein